MHDFSTDTVWVGMDVHQDSITAAILFVCVASYSGTSLANN